ncbi:hypothetical protein D0T60_09635 [Bacteroides sp. 224]|nr:hypothetical protein [Bacteroides sp. 224]
MKSVRIFFYFLPDFIQTIKAIKAIRLNISRKIIHSTLDNRERDFSFRMIIRPMMNIVINIISVIAGNITIDT